MKNSHIKFILVYFSWHLLQRISTETKFGKVLLFSFSLKKSAFEVVLKNNCLKKYIWLKIFFNISSRINLPGLGMETWIR